MGLLANIFNMGGKPILDGANEILKSVDGLHTSQQEKASIRSSIITKVIDAQTAVIVAEAQAGGVTSRWRPITMLSFVALILCHYAIFPMLAVMFPAAAPVFAAMALPPELWLIIKIGLGGYAGARTAEKLAISAAPLMTARQELKKIKLELKGK